MNSLNNKVCIITGAGRGIGREIAELFATEGAKVYALDICSEDLKWTIKVDIYRSNVIPVVIDICDFTAVKDEIVGIKKKNGHIDVLVNNAGLITYELMSMIDYDKLRKMFEVNVIALIYMTQLVSRIMSRQKSGSIINMASMVGVKGAAGQMSYSATKGAVVSVTRSAAKELANSNIRVNAIAPGMVGTERFKAVLEEKFREKIADIPFGRLAEPKDIANVCLFLASDMSSYITGQVIGVDGGIIL